MSRPTVPRASPHALICPFSGGTWGHVIRDLALAEVLAARGYRITFACENDVESRITAAGFAFVEHHNLRSQRLLHERGRKTVRLFGDELARARALLGTLGVDVVITDLMPVMNVAAALECVPSLSMLNLELVLSPLSWWNKGLEFVFQQLGVPRWAASRLYGDALVVVDGAESLGLRDLDPADSAAITGSVREVRFVGPVQRPSTTRWAPPRRARPLVVISLGGGKSSILTYILPQCSAVDADLLLVTGGALSDEATASIEMLRQTRTVEVVDFLADFGEVICAADALVTHGGHGTLLQALTLGVPTIAVPVSVEQEVNTKRLRGIGNLVVPAMTGSTQLAPVLELLLRDRERDQERRRVGDVLASYGGVADAAQLVDRVATARLPEAGPA